MGSIGQYPGVKDYISNAWIENVTLLNGENGARLKAWAGPNVGYGYIDNITYKDIHIENTDHPIVLVSPCVGSYETFTNFGRINAISRSIPAPARHTRAKSTSRT